MTESRRPYLTVPRFTAVPGLVHGFGRAGWGEADFLAFAEARGLTPVIMRQLHSDFIHRLDDAPSHKLEGDALITNVPGLLLVIRTADCLPVLLVDEARRAVAAVHCGWRGTEKRILEKAVRAMVEAYGSKPGEMLAALGPCIGPACYEVGPEVRAGFLKAGFPAAVFAEKGNAAAADNPVRSRRSGSGRTKKAESRDVTWGHVPEAQAPLLEPKFLLALRAANVYLLDKAGVKRENVISAGPVCTHCEPRLLSYRRDRHDPRRMANFIGLA